MVEAELRGQAPQRRDAGNGVSHDDGRVETIFPFRFHLGDARRPNTMAITGNPVPVPRVRNNFHVSHIIYAWHSGQSGPWVPAVMEAQDLGMRVEHLGKPVGARIAPTDNGE